MEEWHLSLMNFFLDKSAHDIRIAIKLWKAELEFM